MGVPGGGAFHHCEGRLVLGAVPPPAARPLERVAGVPRPVCPGCGRRGPGDPHRPHSVRPCGPALLAVGVAEGCPRGGCLPPLWGASEARRRPSPNCPPTGRAVGVRHPRAVGAGVWVLGPNTVPSACMSSGGCMPRGWWGAVPGGVACHRCEGRLVSGAVPPPAARPLERAARVPRPVCPGCGRRGRGDPAPAPQRAPLRAGVARCGGGGRASPGGVPSTIVRGVWGQALSLPRLPAHWGGCWGPPPTCCGRGCVGVGAQHCPLGLHALWGLHAAGAVGGHPRGGWPATVVRGACCQALSLPRPPVLWSGQPGFRVPCVPGAVGADVGTQHRPHSVRPCGPALLAVGETVTGAMTGSTTGTITKDGIKIVEDIRRRAARWRWRGTGDEASNQRRRARMWDIGCSSRGMGTLRGRCGQEAGCPWHHGVRPHRRSNRSRSSKVRAVPGSTTLTVGFSF